MLRFLTRLHLQTHRTERSLVQFYSEQFTPKNLQTKPRPKPYMDSEKQWKSLMKYFKTSPDRHKMFQKDSKIVYQFDDETKGLAMYDCMHFGPTVDWNQPTTNVNNNELICAFDSLLYYCNTNNIPLSDEQFDEFIDNFIQRLQDFTLNEVMQVLQSFARYPLDRHEIRQRNWIELFQAIDQACTIRAADALPQQLLFISSIWLDIPFAKRSWCTILVARLLNRYLKTMSAAEMAQALFFINCIAQPITDIRAFENIFEEKIDNLTLEEFATVLWTFIRLETKVEKQELKEKFFNYLEKHDFSQLADPYLAKILIVSDSVFRFNIS